MSGNKFKASEYIAYNHKFNYDLYRELHELFDEIFTYLPFEKNQFDDLLDKEKQFEFVYDGLRVCIDRQFCFYQAELIGTQKLSIKERIKLHKLKLKRLKKNLEVL